MPKPKIERPVEDDLRQWTEANKVDWITFEMPYSKELFIRVMQWCRQNHTTTKPTEHLQEYLRLELDEPHLQMQFKLEFSELIIDQWGKL